MRGLAALGVACVVGFSGAASALTLTSSDIQPGGKIPDEQVFKGWGCGGGNVSPSLAWSNAP